MAQTTANILWIQTLLTELGIAFTSPCIYFNNQSTVALAYNPVLHARTKHMEIDLFFVREKVLQKQLEVIHIPAKDQWAGVLTKPLSPARFLQPRDKLNVAELASTLHPP